LAGGLIAGLIGYLTVAAFFAVINVISGQSIFHTAALYGSYLFYGLTDPAALEIAVGPVAAFNAVHLILFLILGIGVSWVFVLGERFPVMQYFLFALLLVVAFHLFVAMVLLARPIAGNGAWWRMGIASMAAAGAMGIYLLRAHPVLLQELKELPWDRVPEESGVERGTRADRGEIRTPVLTPSDIDEIAKRAGAATAEEVLRLVQSHRALQGEIARLRDDLGRAAIAPITEGAGVPDRGAGRNPT